MGDTVIQVENLGKMYRIRHGGQADRPRYTALRDVLADRARSVVRSLVVPWSRSPVVQLSRGPVVPLLPPAAPPKHRNTETPATAPRAPRCPLPPGRLRCIIEQNDAD